MQLFLGQLSKIPSVTDILLVFLRFYSLIGTCICKPGWISSTEVQIIVLRVFYRSYAATKEAVIVEIKAVIVIQVMTENIVKIV